MSDLAASSDPKNKEEQRSQSDFKIYRKNNFKFVSTYDCTFYKYYIFKWNMMLFSTWAGKSPWGKLNETIEHQGHAHHRHGVLDGRRAEPFQVEHKILFNIFALKVNSQNLIQLLTYFSPKSLLF